MLLSPEYLNGQMQTPPQKAPDNKKRLARLAASTKRPA
jgi:hypothetical protein